MVSEQKLGQIRKRFGIYKSPYSLYRYKVSCTPQEFTGEQTIEAFELQYDRKSKKPSLQHNQGENDGVTATFFNAVNYPPGTIIDTIIGWYVDQRGRAYSQWQNLMVGVQREAQTKLEKRKRIDWVKLRNGHVDGINRLWAIRGYYIGPNKSKAPPCITVLCDDKATAQYLVDCIHDKLHLYQGWGATMLPRVKVLHFGSTPGSNDGVDKGDDFYVSDEDSLDATDDGQGENKLIRIDVGSPDNHSMPTMTNRDLSSWKLERHRCGIQVEIVLGSDVIAKATIGGLITVGDEVYGLTVGHLFSPVATGDEQDRQSLSSETISTMKAWQEGRECGMEFDWALVKIPGLQQHAVKSWMDVNLVRTVSGEFRPVLITLEKPLPYTHVVLATPGSTHCLRGVLVGPGAIVNIPGSPTPYATWVCRMELPWLIQSGDSGSWLLDAENGMLIGVLVASCPELQEVYIIPAHEIFDDIKRHYPGVPNYPDLAVNLPNCLPIPRIAQIHQQRLINEYGPILESFKNFDSLQDLEERESRITKWTDEKFRDFTSVLPSSYYLQQDRRKSPWRYSQSVLHYHRLTEEKTPDCIESESTSDRLKDLIRTAIQQPPLQCYNAMNALFVAHQDPQSIDILLRLWRCLMLGISNYEEDMLEAKDFAYNLMIEREVRLMTCRACEGYAELRSPWEVQSVGRKTDRYTGVFPWYGHASAHRFPEPPPNTLRYWHPLGSFDELLTRITEDTIWPPWDRLSARNALDRLGTELGSLFAAQRRGVRISLPETRTLGKFYLYVL